MDYSHLNINQEALRPRIRNRAEEFINECQTRLEMLEQTKDKDYSIEVIVSVGLESVSIGTMGAIAPDFIICKGKNRAGILQAIIAPVEQVSFSMISSKITPETPKRKIGFTADLATD